MNRRSDGRFALPEQRAAETRWAMALALFGLIGLLAALRYTGPTALPAKHFQSASEPATESAASTSQVTAAGALETLDMLLGEDHRAHPAGSQENELFRIRLLGALNDLGVQSWSFPFEHDQLHSPKLRQSVSTKGMVNVVARVDGKPRARPLVLATHYDSCPQGPGAGDAGQCVAAIIEILRALKVQPLEYELWCVFTDAEELGLLGARELVECDQRPWGDLPPLVINFDARGDRGAVLLYETHSNNLRAMQIAAPALASPAVSTSLMVNIYQRLPNATDFTVFREVDYPGWNFAVIGGAERYHTAEDSLANLSPRSIQHFAEHGINLVRRLDRLGNAEIASIESSEPAVFFDILGLFLLVYPASWNWPHWSLITIAMIAFGSGKVRFGRGLLAIGILVGTLVVAGLFGWTIALGLKAADLLPRPFVSNGYLFCLLYFVAGAFLVLGVGRLLAYLCNRVEMLWSLVATLQLLAATACSFLPGGAYLLLWPGSFLVTLLILDGRKTDTAGRMHESLGLIGCLVPALLFAPTYVLLGEAMGPAAGGLLVMTATLGLLPTTIALAPVGSTLAEFVHHVDQGDGVIDGGLR